MTAVQHCKMMREYRPIIALPASFIPIFAKNPYSYVVTKGWWFDIGCEGEKNVTNCQLVSYQYTLGNRAMKYGASRELVRSLQLR